MREELPRVIAFLFVSSAIGLMEIAAFRALARALREAREDWRAWRAKRRRARDVQVLQAYEAEVAHIEDEIRGDR